MNFFVTDDNKVLHNTLALSWLFITSITKDKRATPTRTGERSLIGRNLNYTGSLEDELLAMPWRR